MLRKEPTSHTPSSTTLHSTSSTKAASPFKVVRNPRPQKITIDKPPTSPKRILFGGQSRENDGNVTAVGMHKGPTTDKTGVQSGHKTSDLPENSDERKFIAPTRLSGRTQQLVHKLREREKLKNKVDNKDERDIGDVLVSSETIEVTEQCSTPTKDVKNDAGSNSEDSRPIISITSLLSVDEKLVLDKYVKCK